jgi:hypothetical protein
VILDYGVGQNQLYYGGALPFSWTNVFVPVSGVQNIEGSLFADPDIFYDGVIAGGAVAVAGIATQLLLNADVIGEGNLTTITPNTVVIASTIGSIIKFVEFQDDTL